MKRTLCLIIVLMLLNVAAFAEVSEWAKGDVEKAKEIDILPQGFEGDWQKAATREEFCEGIIRTLAYSLDYELSDFLEYAEGVERKVGIREGHAVENTQFIAVNKTDKAVFTDCDNPFVLLAADLGIVTGMGDGAFAPEKEITREEAAVMLTRARFLCSKTMGYSNEYFADYNLVSDWAKKAVRHMKSSGVMSGVGENMFAPKDSYTREMAVITFIRFAYTDFEDNILKVRPTKERVLKYYEEHPIYYIKSTIETPYGDVLVIGSGGAMHTGGETLVLLTEEGVEHSLSKDVPYKSPWAQASCETIELSEDGKTLTYTYSFDKRETFSMDPGNEQVPIRVLHEKGTYVFTANLETKEVTFVINE